MSRKYRIRLVRCPICKFTVTGMPGILNHMEVCEQLPKVDELIAEKQGKSWRQLAQKYGCSDTFLRKMVYRFKRFGYDESVPLYQPERKPRHCTRCKILVTEDGLCDWCKAEGRKNHERTRTAV